MSVSGSPQEQAGGGRCVDADCPVPVPHAHTGEMVDSTFEEWWCPTTERWEMCPGPCPDGTKHTERRAIPTVGERIALLRAPVGEAATDG